jgi:hypothetical protein
MKTIGKHILYLSIIAMCTVNIIGMYKSYLKTALPSADKINMAAAGVSEHAYVPLRSSTNISIVSQQEELPYSSIFLSPPALLISWLIMVKLIFSLFAGIRPKQIGSILP